MSRRPRPRLRTTSRPRSRRWQQSRRGPARRADPQRTCVGCRRRGAPDTLVRLAASADGAVRIGRNVPGRGAWLCRDRRECLELAIRRRALGRALRIELTARDVTALRVRLYGAPAQ
ncbi:MAG: YlxR family protein [Acidimicrobiia bacterium]